VFSTLHTNDAPTSVTRLKDMGVPAFLITATVEAILAQRLVRRVCSQCREEVAPSEELLVDLGMKAEQMSGKRVFRGRGCEVCNNTGYKGRVGLFELMMMNDQLRDMVMMNSSIDEMRKVAQSYGMVTLREAGLNFAFDGTTTLDEVVRETILEA
jgi:type IV pilus assembly protein PilB